MLLTTFSYTYKASHEHEQKVHASSIMGMFNVCGCNVQLKHIVCDICRPCQLILSMLKPVFHHLRHIRCAYNFLWCLYLQVWRFCVHDDNNMVVKLLSYYRHCIATHLCYHGYATVYYLYCGWTCPVEKHLTLPDEVYKSIINKMQDWWRSLYYCQALWSSVSFISSILA